MQGWTAERRAEARLPASLLVTYASESLALSGVATDLSPSGLFVETDLLDTVGTQAFLRLTDGAGGRVEAVGEVVRTVCEPAGGMPGMGVRFLELGTDAVRWIRRYCSSYASCVRVVLADADPAALDFASRAVESVGARPLCLGPEVASVASVARLEPHVVVLGRDLGATNGVALAAALRHHPELCAADVFVAAETDLPALAAAAADAGLGGALGWRDDRALLRAVDGASRRLGRGPALPPRGHFWLN